MIAAQWGRVINTSSVADMTGGPQNAHYAVAKAAIIGFTRSLALEYARSGITVNAVAPISLSTAFPCAERTHPQTSLLLICTWPRMMRPMGLDGYWARMVAIWCEVFSLDVYGRWLWRGGANETFEYLVAHSHLAAGLLSVLLQFKVWSKVGV